jgi:uncharacterized iron-regulated membrane protein
MKVKLLFLVLALTFLVMSIVGGSQVPFSKTSSGAVQGGGVDHPPAGLPKGQHRTPKVTSRNISKNQP